MKHLRSRPYRVALGLFALSVSTNPIVAGALQVVSIDTSSPNIGSVVFSSAGDTVFTIAAGTGAVSRKSGAGVRVTSGNASTALLQLTCTGEKKAGDCLTTTATVTITAAGTPSGKGKSLTNFTIAPGPQAPSVLSAAVGTTSVTFTVGGIPLNGTGNVYVGMDFPISGTTGSTGPASSGFVATTGNGSKATSATGSAVANVLRPISITSSSSLNFGMVARPRTGNGVVTLDPSSGTVSVTGIGSGAFASPSPSAAGFSAGGEGGQTFSISAPPFDLNRNGGGTLTVTPSFFPNGSVTIGGSVGSAGTKDFTVGGSFPISDTTPAGIYNGTLIVTVQYN